MKYRLAKREIIFLGVSFFVVDRIAKSFVLRTSAQFDLIPFLRVNFYQNYGAALGIPVDKVLLLTLIIFSLGFIVYLFLKELKRNNFLNAFFLTIIFVGACSNLADRLIYGFVIDFIDVSFFSIFNFADIYITLGVAGYIYLNFKIDFSKIFYRFYKNQE